MKTFNLDSLQSRVESKEDREIALETSANDSELHNSIVSVGNEDPSSASLLDVPSHDVPPVHVGGKRLLVTGYYRHLLLITDDKSFGDYLGKAFSGYFRLSLLETAGVPLNISKREIPDAIIIDEGAAGRNGDELCEQIKADSMTSSIPVILLVNDNEGESYLSHIGSKVDRLELRTVNVYKLIADIHLLINSYESLRDKMKQILAKSISIELPVVKEKKDANLEFVNKLEELLEENISKRKYTIDSLRKDMGMSRSVLYHQMKKVTGKSPEEYIFSFKMEKAKMLLAFGEFDINVIADTLGYCDAKYFSKKFKEYYHVCPTLYLKSLRG